MIFFIARVGEGNLLPGKIREKLSIVMWTKGKSIGFTELCAFPWVRLPVSFPTLSKAAFSMMTWIYCYLVQNPEEQHTHQSQCVHYNSIIVCHIPSVCEMTANTGGCSFPINILNYLRTVFIRTKSASSRMLLCLEQYLT